jgi:uncharacterized membrane protein HdeD (DUF308 family)
MLYIIFGAAALVIIVLALMNRVSFNILLTTLGFMPLLTGIRHLVLESLQAKSETRRSASKNVGIIYIILGVLIIFAPMFIKF